MFVINQLISHEFYINTSSMICWTIKAQHDNNKSLFFFVYVWHALFLLIVIVKNFLKLLSFLKKSAIF